MMMTNIISITLVAAILGFSNGQSCSNVSPQLSCGLSYKSQSQCLSAGCCWEESSDSCFVPSVLGYAFNLTASEQSFISGKLSIKESLSLFNGLDFDSLDVEIIQETNLRTHITIIPTGSERWRVPETIIPRPGGRYDPAESAFPGAPFTKASVHSDPFRIQVDFANSGANPNGRSESIFNFSESLVFQDQYIQFVLNNPIEVLATYGFGESTRDSQQLQDGSVYTLWSSDTPAADFDKSLYGTHPFFVQVSSSGKAHGVLFLNNNAMELTVEGEGGAQRLGVQATGGIVEIYVFGGPTPEAVVRQYLEVIGKPAMVPFWSLGFHNCRWGYPNISQVEEVVANYSAAEIPLETQWLDIDYMLGYLDFVLDPINYPLAEVQSFVASLHANNQRFVPIIDPAIYVLSPTYSTYTTGVADDVFVKDYTGKDFYLSQVWPGPTYFPDWFAKNTDAWWLNELQMFFDMIPYDGLWIDMNEPSNFCNGNGTGQVCQLVEDAQCGGTVCCLNCTIVDDANSYDFPPFTPHVSKGSLGGNTLPMSALHGGEVAEYNAHTLYGLMESISTFKAVVAITEKRPFILSRSTFPSSGVFAAHWTGDNTASWEYLRASIVSMNNMALFGVPMVGADICGFFNTTTEELCARWIEVGAFSPFSRDHSNKSSPSHELYKWDTVAEASRSTLGLRYKLLPHLYTLMYQAHKFGNTVHNALWMHFSGDSNTLSVDEQYMWGGSLLFTPVVTLGATSVTGYFPRGVWYSMFGNDVIDHSEGGNFVTLETPLTATNVHLRGGHVVPAQESAMTTTEVHSSAFTLLVALESYGFAAGTLYVDDGVQYELAEFIYVEYIVFNSTLTSKVVNSSYSLATALLSNVEVYGVDSAADTCTVVLTIFEDGQPAENIAPEVVSLAKYKDFAKLTIQFSSESAVNIASNYDMRWRCSANSEPTDDAGSDDDTPTDDGDSSSSNSDEKGWSAIPEYGQALIIVSIVIVAVGVIGVGVYIWKGKQLRRDTMSESLM